MKTKPHSPQLASGRTDRVLDRQTGEGERLPEALRVLRRWGHKVEQKNSSRPRQFFDLGGIDRGQDTHGAEHARGRTVGRVRTIERRCCKRRWTVRSRKNPGCALVGRRWRFLLAGAASARADDTLTTVTRPTLLSAEGRPAGVEQLRPGLGPLLADDELRRHDVRRSGAPRAVPFDVDLGVTRIPATSWPHIPAAAGSRPAATRRSATRSCRCRTGRAGAAATSISTTSTPARRAPRRPKLQARLRVPPLRLEGPGRLRSLLSSASSAGGLHPHLYLRSLNGRRGARRLPGGPRSRLRFCTGTKPRHCRRKVEPGPTALDLEGRRLAFAWDSGYADGPLLGRLPRHDRSGGARSAGSWTGRSSPATSRAREVLTPTIDDGQVFWELTLYGDTTSNTLHRLQISTGRIQVAGLPGPGSQETYLRRCWPRPWPPERSITSPRVCRRTSPAAACRPPARHAPGCSDAGPCQIRLGQPACFSDRR